LEFNYHKIGTLKFKLHPLMILFQPINNFFRQNFSHPPK
jgi:hypothetical protein